MKSLHKIFTLLLIIISFTACTSTSSNLANGSDEDSDIGLGGTGLLAGNLIDDRGLGGTGILGKITGFGSIFVNGIEVEYNDTTPFSINGEKAKYQHLHIGDIVEILTADAKKHTHAVAINLRHEIIGVVSSVDPATYSFMIDDQKIIQPINTLSYPEIGERVAVAGFRVNKQTIMSSRITTTTKTNLIRTRMDLPFRHKSSQWLVQLHIQEKTNFELNGVSHAITVDKADNAIAKPFNIRILKLKHSASKGLILKESINPTDIPVGRPTFEPANGGEQNGAPNQQPWANPKQWQKNGAGSDSNSGPGSGSGSQVGTGSSSRNFQYRNSQR